MQRKIRMGMVGGGRGAFIGAVHRMAAALDGEIELVCGVFSSDPEKSKLSGEDLMLAPERCYGSFQEMIQKEKRRKDKMDIVSIVTPNHVHFAPSKMALENGFDVICDKPVTFSLAEAKKLKQIIEKTGRTFALTHTYTGYPMVKEAREMCKNGVLGTIRKVMVEYPQGWLNDFIEGTSKQASWRTDPAKSGMGGAVGDIGTHAENLAETITGLHITEVCADVTIMVAGRLLDDDANVLIRFNNGAKGVLSCSQIANGDENNLNIRVYGDKGSIEWHQMEPNTLIHKNQYDSTRIIRTGVGKLSAMAMAHTRVPAGHPEGYLEAFANIYRNFARTVRKRMNAEEPNEFDLDFPTIEEGIRGMAFVETIIASGKSKQKWVAMK